MDLEQMKIQINESGFLDLNEKKILQRKYHELFTQMYGKDIYDSILKHLNENTRLYEFFNSLSHNNHLANIALEQVNDGKLSLLTIHSKDELKAAARIRRIDENTASIPDAVFLADMRYKLKLWQKILKYAEEYFKDAHFKEMYVEVLLNDFVMIAGCFDEGFTEYDEVKSEQTRTHLFSKKLERKR